MIQLVKRMSAIMLLVIFTYGCGGSANQSANENQDTVKSEQVAYTCPMHPEVTADEPGSCPICGMNLVEADKVAKDSLHQSHDTLNHPNAQ